MNVQTLKGIIKNIKPSHMINTIEYEQAEIICPRANGKEDNISIKFKRYSNRYTEGDTIELTGNLRSYSKKLQNGKNKVSLYVFTYFDLPEEDEVKNSLVLDGRICKIDEIRKTKDGKENIHLTIANNLIIEENNQKLNSYIPCIAWGRLAKFISNLHVNDKVLIHGELHSREYKKMLTETDFEFRVAHEVVINQIEVIE